MVNDNSKAIPGFGNHLDYKTVAYGTQLTIQLLFRKLELFLNQKSKGLDCINLVRLLEKLVKSVGLDEIEKSV